MQLTEVLYANLIVDVFAGEKSIERGQCYRILCVPYAEALIAAADRTITLSSPTLLRPRRRRVLVP